MTDQYNPEDQRPWHDDGDDTNQTDRDAAPDNAPQDYAEPEPVEPGDAAQGIPLDAVPDGTEPGPDAMPVREDSIAGSAPVAQVDENAPLRVSSAYARTPEAVVPPPGEPLEPPPALRPFQHAVPPLRVRPADLLVTVLLLVVLAAGAWLRFDGQNWDDYTHLHPDERFLTDVVGRLNGPLDFTDPSQPERDEHRQTCAERYPVGATSGDEFETLLGAGRGPYFDAECSPLNPNNLGAGIYVYGEFPLFTVHAAGVARSELSRDIHAFLEAYDTEAAADYTITTHWEGYNGAHLIGRSIAALADTLTILFVFLIGRRLYGRWTGLLAAALYAFAGFPIQQAHFWTVDAFTTLWVVIALYFAVRALDGAGALRGPTPLVYLLIWAGGTVWDAAYNGLPMLGLVTLGAAFVISVLLAYGVQFVLRLRGRSGGDIVVAASGVLASMIYLAAWLVLIATRLDDFALENNMIGLGVVSLVYALAALVAYLAAGAVRRHMLGMGLSQQQTLAVAAIGVVWVLLAVGYLAGGLSPWGALFVALAAVALLVTDITDLTDYLLFGAALGGAVASRVNIAPLAGIIVLAAALRALPALDRRIHGDIRARLVFYAGTGVLTAALASFIVFRLLQPHAFLGPEIYGLEINPGWREDVSEAAHMTSGAWDAPPNHQWADRTPYLFPWRNIVLWGMGLPLGLVAWGAWLVAGIGMLRAKRQWTRHAIPVLWTLVIFGWLGGRWVTTMRYFLPIYPTLILLAAWGLVTLVRRAWAARGVVAQRRRVLRPLAVAGTVVLLIGVLGATVVYGLAVHNIHTHQLTRVAASRWFQETVPGDFGLWVEGADGSRQMVNIGRGAMAVPPHVFRLAEGETTEIAFTLTADATFEMLTFHLLGDPARDSGAEVVRVRIVRDDPGLGRQVLYEDTIDTDLNTADSPYGQAITLRPEEPVELPALGTGDQGIANYAIEVTAVDGGPVMSVREMSDPPVGALNDVALNLRTVADDLPMTLDLNFDQQPLIAGHGNDIPATPTHWSTTRAHTIPFDIPIDGDIRELTIPHLGDPLNDADAETVRFTLTGPDGATASATLTADLSAQGDATLGPPQTIIFDPPLPVQRTNAAGERLQATLTIEPEDLVYTSGPVVAWEGDWDDPVPWPTCPLPDDVAFRADLPSGMSEYNCISMNMYSGFYQGLKLWMVAEDTEQKRHAIQNALDQADYIVITSNRFYDSLSRIPWRWPMTLAYYDALFDGELGFELVKTFDAPPQLGPLRFDDQVLPTDDLPDWLNEYWEAEEAFHVYDHPVVMVFAKTEDYSPENTRAVLTSESIRPVTSAVPGYVADTEPVGVVVQGAQESSKAPTLLHLTDDQWQAQQDGGTWSELFDLDSLLNRSQIVAVIAWWLLIVAAGWIVWPLLFASFPALPDRGFPAAKITIWLIVAWIAWVGGTLSLPAWSRSGLALILLGVAVLSLLVIWRRRVAFVTYIRTHWRYLLAVEALAALLYGAFLFVRLGNPDLWHNAFGGEKPMDFAYFNAVLRSSVFPPLDPWFAGGYINYYYWGYVLVGAPVKLLGIRPALAYNLIIPALYSMTGLGVFTIAYNWVRARRDTPVNDDRDGAPGEEPGDLPQQNAVPALARADSIHTIYELPAAEPEPPEPDDPESDPRRGWLPRGNPWVAGLLALLLAMVLGNLATIRVFVTNVAKLDEGGYTQPALFHQVRLQEIEAQRNEIYQEFYAEERGEFKDEHGREPQTSDEAFRVTQQAQARTDAYIENYAYHPPLWELWEYEIDNNLKLLESFVGGLDQVLAGRDLPMSSHRWYWAPTRIISELPNGAGNNAIVEMPYFTFLYGDLHAHMLAFPITLLVVLWLVAEIIGAGRALRRWWEAGIALGIGALAVGVLRPTNSWDWITYLLLGVAGLTYVVWIDASRRADQPAPAYDWLWRKLRPGRVGELWWLLLALPLGLLARLAFYGVQYIQADQQAARGLNPGEMPVDPTLTLLSALLWAVAALGLVIIAYVVLLVAFRANVNRRVLVGWIGRVGGFVALTYIAALPFTAYFATAYTSIKPWDRDTTPLWAYMYVHGTFIFIVVAFLLWQSARWLRHVTVRELQGQAVPVLLVGVLLVATVLGGIVYGVREAAVAQLVVPLIAWATLLFFLPGQHRLLRAMYAMIVLALAISFGVELVVLEGDIGRQNTVFKFYLQVWFILSIVGGVVLAWMLQRAGRWRLPLQGLWYGGLAILFTLALLYPVLATQARSLDRFAPDETPATLDGMDYMQYAVHGEHDLWFPLEGDYAMIRWLQDNVAGTPVVAEAHLYPSEYHWGARISIYTGLPTILGWRFHQTQQHSLEPMNLLVQTRENNAAAFYETTGEGGIETALALADHYDIEYVVVGALERAFYGDIEADPETQRQTAGHSEGLAKFDTMVEMNLLTVEYEAPRCLDYGTPVEECAPDQVYYDRIYRFVPDTQASPPGAAAPVMP